MWDVHCSLRTDRSISELYPSVETDTGALCCQYHHSPAIWNTVLIWKWTLEEFFSVIQNFLSDQIFQYFPNAVKSHNDFRPLTNVCMCSPVIAVACSLSPSALGATCPSSLFANWLKGGLLHCLKFFSIHASSTCTSHSVTYRLFPKSHNMKQIYPS